MQQPPHFQTTRTLRAGHPTPALLPSPPPTGALPAPGRMRWPHLAPGRQATRLRRLCCELVLGGLLLGICFWLLFPLPGEAQLNSQPAHLLPAWLPWLSALFWPARLPWLQGALSHISWLDLRSGQAQAAGNLMAFVLGVALLLVVLLARRCQRATRERLPERAMGLVLALLCLLTSLFGICFVLLPGGLTQMALFSGLAGHAALAYHINPYLLAGAGRALAHDPLFQALSPGSLAAPITMGPLWLDISVPLSWLAHDNPALVILVFRLAGLCLHLLNSVLIWVIVEKRTPELRLSRTLLYAWNPVFLLLGIGELQVVLAVVSCLLLAVVLVQHHLLQLSWVALLLASLIEPLCLLLLPLFVRPLAREMRLRMRRSRILWWIGLLGVCLLVVVLAYAPYWPGAGAHGIALHLRAVFWPQVGADSLLAALRSLPFASWPPAAWMLAQVHWMLLPGVLVAGLLLLGIWVTDTLQLALLFASWIFLALVLLFPLNLPWLIVPSLALTMASGSRRTALLAHLLGTGSLLAYALAFWPLHWSGQGLITIGLPALIWGWLLFFASTWQMAHHDEQEAHARLQRKRPGLSRPSWPPRPAAWPQRPGLPG